MDIFCSVGEFNSEEEELSLYMEWIQPDFAANDMTSVDHQLLILSSVCGASTYKLMSRLLFKPRKMGDVPLSELISIVEQHRNLEPSVIMQHDKLKSHSQEGGKSISDYVAA